jgi:hypothetical protein
MQSSKFSTKAMSPPSSPPPSPKSSSSNSKRLYKDALVMGIAKKTKSVPSSSQSSSTSSRRSYKDALMEQPKIFDLKDPSSASSSCSSSSKSHHRPNHTSPKLLTPTIPMVVRTTNIPPDASPLPTCGIAASYLSPPVTSRITTEIVPVITNEKKLYENSNWLSKHDMFKIPEIKRNTKKRSPHRAASTIMVGSFISNRGGDFLPKATPLQKRRIRGLRKGTVQQELGKGRWLVEFENGIIDSLSSSQMKLISNESVDNKMSSLTACELTKHDVNSNSKTIIDKTNHLRTQSSTTIQQNNNKQDDQQTVQKMKHNKTYEFGITRTKTPSDSSFTFSSCSPDIGEQLPPNKPPSAYDIELLDARKRISLLEGETVSLTNKTAKMTMIWTVVKEHVNPDGFRKDRAIKNIGITDELKRQKILSSSVPLAELFLELTY